MDAGFRNELKAELIKDDKVWKLTEMLLYYSKVIDSCIFVPKGFETDLASVPRLPGVYTFWGGRAHREGVLHDFLFRKDSTPLVSFMTANKVFLEAMESRGKRSTVRYPMYWGVCLGAYPCYHKRSVGDQL